MSSSVKKNEENENANISWTAKPTEFLVPPPPKIEKRIKIIKNNDGEVEVFENEDVMINSGSESIKEMDKEGKVIIIKKIKNKGDKEIEVEIQKKETEESHKND